MGRSLPLVCDLGAGLVRLVRAGLGRSEAAGIVGMRERTFLAWQALGRRGHPDFRPWVEAIDEAARMARRERNGGGPKALEAMTRGLLMATLRWRWVVRPRVLELIRRPAGWFVWWWSGRRARIETGPGALRSFLRSLRDPSPLGGHPWNRHLLPRPPSPPERLLVYGATPQSSKRPVGTGSHSRDIGL
jgi:hypothetical protein